MIDWLLMGWETSLHQTGSLVVGHYEIVAGRGSREDAIDVVVNVFFVVVFFLMATGIERSLITVKVAHFYRWAADTFHFLALFIRFPSTAIIIGSRRKFGIAFLQHKAPSVFTRFRGWPRQPKETIKRNLLARVEQAVGCYLAAYRRSPFTFFPASSDSSYFGKSESLREIPPPLIIVNQLRTFSSIGNGRYVDGRQQQHNPRLYWLFIGKFDGIGCSRVGPFWALISDKNKWMSHSSR